MTTFRPPEGTAELIWVSFMILTKQWFSLLPWPLDFFGGYVRGQEYILPADEETQCWCKSCWLKYQRGGGLKKWETLRKTSTALASENWLFWTKLVRCRTRQRIRKHIPVFSRVEPPPVGRVKGPDAPLRAGRWRDCFQSLMKGGCWRLSPVTLVIDMLSGRPLALFGVSRRDGP